MQIMLVGYRSRDAAAMEVLVGKTLQGWTCHNVATLAELAQAPAGLCVVDLPGLGMMRYSEAAAAELQRCLAGRRPLSYSVKAKKRGPMPIPVMQQHRPRGGCGGKSRFRLRTCATHWN